MITKYKQFENNVYDEEPTKEYLDDVKKHIHYKYKNIIDFENQDIKEFILNCELDGMNEYLCAYHIMRNYNKENPNSDSKFERYLKIRPEAQ
ncbi:MAG: hypothetical protein ACOC2W_04460 [bacterium]